METIEKIKLKTSITSKTLWSKEAYREKVIKGVSKPRPESFKLEQSERITKWFQDNPNQRELRSRAMKQSWIDGKIQPSLPHYIIKSKKEIRLAELLKQELPSVIIDTKAVIRINGSWFYPDILIDDFVIIEFMGNYFHMNPSLYGPYDFNQRLNKYAHEIWDHDNHRLDQLESLNYKTLQIWESEFDSSPKEAVSRIISFNLAANWECDI